VMQTFLNDVGIKRLKKHTKKSGDLQYNG